jgi:hypothetical protein
LFLYEVSLYVTAAAFMAFLTLNMLLSLMHVQKWVSDLLNNIVQFLIIGGLMLLYRPTGKKIDDFLEPDMEGGEQQRSEIALEELETFEVEDGGQGMQEWEEGMNLPLQPLLVSSRANRRGTGPREYAEMDTM